MKYAVTGGAGFIGTNVVAELLNGGHEVTVIDDLSGGKRERVPDGVRFIERDVRDTPLLINALSGIDVAVHLAAQPRVQYSIEHPKETFEVNVSGTLSVLEAARAAGVRRVVFASTSAVYGDQEVMPLTEHMEIRPKSPYALHKEMGEGLMNLYQSLYGLETVSLRFFNVYGPHLDPDGPYALVVGQFLKRAANGEPITIFGDGAQTRDFVHVHDVARAITLASESHDAPGRIFNIGSGTETSIRELATLFTDRIEHAPPRIEPRRTCADVASARAVLGWEPTVSLKDGIAALKREWGIA